MSFNIVTDEASIDRVDDLRVKRKNDDNPLLC